MKIKSLIKHNLMRAAMTLLVMLPWAANAQTRECNPITTYPWTENFDSYTGTTSGSTNNLPECWNYINTCTHNDYQGYPVVYGANYTSGHSGHNFLYFQSYYQYDPKPQYAILPKMSGLAGKHITLWAMGNLANSTCTFKIGTMSDPADASTFGAFAEQELSDYSLGLGWQEYAFTVPTGTTNTYLAILMEPAPSPNQNNKWISIDDIAVFGDFSQTGDNEYTIFTAAGWGLFCDAIAGGESFNGKTVKLGADITITRMASTGAPYFRGTFDGQGHTLTLDYGTASNPIDAQFVAPFGEITWSTSPTFSNLNISGHIYEAYTGSEAHNIGGLIGHLFGNVTIEHCTSNVEITSTGGASGFVGLCEHTVNFNDCMSSAVIHSAGGNNSGFVAWSRASGWNINFTGCVFNGKLLQINGQGNSNGGFIGWTGSNKTVTITNCLYAPAALAEGEAYASYNSATFARGWQEHCSESYYTTAFGAAQGTQAHSITAGNFVTAANAGTATAYATSGITSYGTGIKYNNVLYAGSGESVALTISNTVPASFNFTGYSVTDGASLSGSGNNYTLTMPNAEVDVVITANCTIPPVSYIDENGVAQTCTYYYPLEGTETTLGTAGQETWYVAQPGTLNYSQGIQLLGNTHIILCDGAALNIGTSDSPVSGDGFYCNGVYDLSVYTQSGNTGALAIYSSQCPFVVNNLTLAGGNVNTTSYYDANCNNLTVCRSTLGISASSGSAIYALGDVTFSYVTATTNGSIICANTNFAVDHSQLTVNATSNTAIQTSGGNVTLSYVTADITSSNYQGFYCSSFAVDNSQLTVTAYYEAINALGGVITLGCTAATDFIKATRTDGYINSSYSGTVKIADGQTLYAGTNAYTGTLTDAERQAIGGQKLTNVAPPTYDYIDINGQGATHTAVVIDADNMPTSLSGWYIVQGTVNYTSTINLAGETHIILADGAVMNVTTTSNYGINGTNGNPSLFVYGQSGQSGQLNVTSNRFAIIIVQGDIAIAGGIVTAEAQYAIYSPEGGDVMIKNATVTATGNNGMAIYTNYGDIIIRNGGKTTANANNVAIYAVVGDITITGCEVEATGGNGIFADNSSNNSGGNVTIQNATVTATTTSDGWVGAIRSYNGDITIDNSNVTASGTGRYGIYAGNSGNILLNGGKITATGNNYGIYAENGNITLGWTNPTDYIYANSYSDMQGDPITLAKTFIDEDGHTYSGTIAMENGTYPIDGKTLYPYISGAIFYLDENGQQRLCAEYTTLNSNMTTLGTADQETWYVADGTLNYGQTITLSGDVHLILKDNAVMNVGTEETPVNGNGIYSEGHSISIYAQSMGESQGQLHVNASAVGIFANGGNITINGGEVVVTSSDTYGLGIFANGGNITINGGNVEATSSGSGSIGIYTMRGGNVVINGGEVVATSSADGGLGIYASGGNITINGGEVSATSTGTDMFSYGIYASNGNITINSGEVTANGTCGIYVGGGDITISGGEVEATGSEDGGEGIIVLDGANGGSISISNATVTATGSIGIHAKSGITINSGTVTANNCNYYGIYASNCSLTISGGQVTANGSTYGIRSEGDLTLGWTNASDYIHANSYLAGGILSIAEGKTFIDEDGTPHNSGTVNASDINGKWLYPNTVSRFTKTIAAHHTEEGVNYGWYLIASPLSGGTNAEAVAHLVNSETPANFDLYRFNQAADLEWENWKQQNSDHYHFNLEPGRGYLYANAADVNLVFAGTPYSGNGEVTITNVAGHPLSGWNLVGNPFAVGATLSQPYYRMNAEGSALKTETENTAVAAMEGVFVQANEDSQTVTFTAQTRGGEKAAIAQANIMVVGDNGAVIDNAIIRFDGGQTLEKFSFREGSTKLYIPQGGKDYAIACAESTGEMPVNFKAEENGTYTLTVSTTLNSQRSTLNYLHLIDNMTGVDIDLLINPSYTFEAKTMDYESRFRLVFVCGDANDDNADAPFAFISNGNLIINGTGTLQIFDILGHQLFTKQLSTLNSQLSTLNYKSGVYVLRLINGENVRTQKIVVE